MVNIKKIVILIFLLPMSLLLCYVPAAAATPFSDIVAASAILAEADSGTLLFDDNMTDRHPADALAKIMMLLVAVSACETGGANPDDLVEMTESAWAGVDSKSTTLDISPGEKLSLLDLMYCAFTGGACEACNMVAEKIAGSVDAFVGLMNARAAEIGCENTNYTNADGQYNEKQYTTAQDQFYIFREAMSHPLFAEIAGAYRYTTAATNMSDPRKLVGSNSLLNANSKYYYSTCTAGLAGATYEGGYSAVAFAQADDLSLISVVLGSDIIILDDESTQMRNLTESRRLFEWGFSEFEWRTILSSNEPVAKAPILHGAGADYVNLRPESSIKLLLSKDIPTDEFEKNVTIYSTDKGEALEAPITAGDVLGEITISRDNVDYGPVKLVANTNIELNRLEFIKMQITDILTSKTARLVIFALILLIILYIALVIRYNVIRRKRIRRIKEAKRRLKAERQGTRGEDE